MSHDHTAVSLDLVRWTFTAETAHRGAITEYLNDLGADVLSHDDGRFLVTWDEPEGELDEIVSASGRWMARRSKSCRKTSTGPGCTRWSMWRRAERRRRRETINIEEGSRSARHGLVRWEAIAFPLFRRRLLKRQDRVMASVGPRERGRIPWPERYPWSQLPRGGTHPYVMSRPGERSG